MPANLSETLGFSKKPRSMAPPPMEEAVEAAPAAAPMGEEGCARCAAMMAALAPFFGGDEAMEAPPTDVPMPEAEEYGRR